MIYTTATANKINIIYLSLISIEKHLSQTRAGPFHILLKTLVQIVNMATVLWQ